MPRNDFIDEERPYGKRSYQRYSKNWHEDECPYCQERRMCKESKECHEKPCCPDWFMCPPPWFWCKPEQEEKKEKKDECDCNRKDDNDKRKERGGDLEAYGYVFSLTATNVVVGPNTDVVFTNNGPLECITHTPNSPQVFIRKSGVYEIYYGVNTTTGSGATISLTVNGAIDPSTTIPIGTSPGETSGKVILSLRAGDFITLRNSSTTLSITLAAAPAIGAQLTLERIDELEKCIDKCQ